ncbi:MAG TPA: hypothetical protein VGL81_13460 [Polyangiaceae bacterium]|jgi:hypothetical protein
MNDSIHLNIDDAAFWSDPWVNLGERVTQLVLEGTPALAFAAPGRVDLRHRDTLPVAVLYVAPRKDTYEFRFENIALVAATRLEDGATFVGRPFEWAAFARIEGEPPPGFVGAKHTAELRQALDLPWRPATYQVWLLFRDQQTKPVRVSVEHTASFEDPEVKKFLEAAALPEPAPPWPAQADPFPTFRPTAGSPPLPERGIALAADRVVVVKKGAVAAVRGSFRLPVARLNVVRHPEGPGPHPTAIVRVTLVITGSEEVGPLVIPLRVPTFDPIPKDAADALVTGHFAVDLNAWPDKLGAGQTLFVRAFAAGETAGPALMGLVPEDGLPGRGL